MNLGTLLVLALALGTDAFSLAVGIGISGIRWAQMLILSLVVAVFHVLMPLLGIVAGRYLGVLAGTLATWVGAGILMFLGASMLWEALKKSGYVAVPLTQARKVFAQERSAPAYNPSLWGLMVLASGVSLDALSVGFTLGTVGAELMVTVLTLGIVSGIMTFGGCLLGQRVGTHVGEKAQIVGGLILLLIGVKLFIGF